jgi:hypothetical protein
MAIADDLTPRLEAASQLGKHGLQVLIIEPSQVGTNIDVLSKLAVSSLPRRSGQLVGDAKVLLTKPMPQALVRRNVMKGFAGLPNLS